jgi:Asp-tRNA(Asn)/Glu-tRNA(Gln) amidotransferase A subunit family amidase
VTRSVRDSAALLDATWGLETGSRYAAPTPERPFLQEVGRDPGRLRIALNLKPMSGSPVDPEVVAAVQAAAKLCESLGHHVEEAAPAWDLEAVSRASFAIISTSVAADLQDREAATGIKPSTDVVEAVTLAYYEMGLKTPGIAVTRANNDLQAAAIAVARFMDRHDLILSPVVASPPPRLGVLSLSPPDLASYYKAVGQYSPFAGLQNQTGQPAMSVPLGRSKDGLPIGVMFSARYGDEATLFRLAGQLEQAAPWAGRRPAL